MIITFARNGRQIGLIKTMLVAVLLVAHGLGDANAGPITPPPGSTERKAICDALRVPVIEEFGVKPIFVITTLNVFDGWAFLIGELKRTDGSRYNAEKLDAERNGGGRPFDGDSVYGILRKKGGRWRVLACHVGPTDASYVTWRREFGAPLQLFGERASNME
jgi:hypothetical protein